MRVKRPAKETYMNAKRHNWSSQTSDLYHIWVSGDRIGIHVLTKYYSVFDHCDECIRSTLRLPYVTYGSLSVRQNRNTYVD